jgi:hypothetical protein
VLQQLPEEVVLLKLLEESGGTGEAGGDSAGAGAEGGGRSGLAARHRSSGSGSSLGGEAEFVPNGVGSGLERESIASAGGQGQGGREIGGSAPGSAASSVGDGEYQRGGTGLFEAGSTTQLQPGGASDDYSVHASSAAAAAAMARHQQTSEQQRHAAPDEPGMTPAHPRAQSRTAALAASGQPPAGQARALATGAAPNAPGAAQQHAAPAAGSAPLPTALRASVGVAAGASLDALVYHPTDSVMKPIVGNKR